MPKQKSTYNRLGLVLIGVALLALAAWGVASRMHSASELNEETQDAAIPKVTVMKAVRGPIEQELVLPGNVQAWHEAPIYARTSGYIKGWKTDIGAKVKEGDLLAEIETPEIDAQRHQAEADVASAQANNQLAQSTAKRWEALLKTNSVSKQEAEEKMGDAAAKQALVASAQANLDHLNQLVDFKRITAPFDGTITARNTDTGALINAGNGGGPELFHIAQIDKLRVYVQVPQSASPFIKPDLTAELNLAEYPQKVFAATFERTAEAIDPTARTLLVQFAVDNANGELLPGSYARVHIKLPVSGDAVHLPVNTLLFRGDGMQVASIDGEGNAVLKPIKIGRDYGKEVEVVSGVEVGDTIIVNPPDSLTKGQKVRVSTPGDKDKDDGKNKDAKDKKEEQSDSKKSDDGEKK